MADSTMKGTARFASAPYYVLCTLLLATLMYSTSLHLFFGSESTLSSKYFMRDPGPSPQRDWLRTHNFVTEDAGALGKLFSEHGIDAPADVLIKPRQRHKLTRFYDDVVAYIIQTNTPDEASPPFKYRFLPTTIVRKLRALTGRGVYVPVLFVWFNFACVLASGVWFIHFLSTQLRFSRALSLLGGVLLVTLVQITATLPFVMLEPASILAALPIFAFAHARRALPFLISVVIAVMVKEVFVFWGLIWPLAHLDLRDRRLAAWLESAALSTIPVVVFAVIRVRMGGSALEVGFGHDLASGDAPDYLAHRLSSSTRLQEVLVSLLLGFGALWLGLVGALRDAFLKRVVWFTPLLVGAALALSGYLGRVVGLLYPILIPGFLCLVRDAAARAEPHPSSVSP